MDTIPVHAPTMELIRFFFELDNPCKHQQFALKKKKKCKSLVKIADIDVKRYNLTFL